MDVLLSFFSRRGWVRFRRPGVGSIVRSLAITEMAALFPEGSERLVVQFQDSPDRKGKLIDSFKAQIIAPISIQFKCFGYFANDINFLFVSRSSQRVEDAFNALSADLGVSGRLLVEAQPEIEVPAESHTESP